MRLPYRPWAFLASEKTESRPLGPTDVCQLDLAAGMARQSQYCFTSIPYSPNSVIPIGPDHTTVFLPQFPFQPQLQVCLASDYICLARAWGLHSLLHWPGLVDWTPAIILSTKLWKLSQVLAELVLSVSMDYSLSSLWYLHDTYLSCPFPLNTMDPPLALSGDSRGNQATSPGSGHHSL